MQARSIDVRNAAVALLNSGPVQAGFAPFAFTALADYLPSYDLKEAKAGLLVTVIAADLAETPFNRIIVQAIASIYVVVQKGVKTLADKDALVLLTQQIKQALESPLVLATAPTDCAWQGTQHSPLYVTDDLQTHNVFTAAPKLTYLTRRAR